MSHITVVFTRRHHIGSVVLRAWMHSRFSHCALLDPKTGTVIEAVPHGVQERKLKELIDQASHHEFVKIPCRNTEQVLAVARGQLGKPYDWKAILGFWFRRSWNQDNAFICSEFVAWCLATVGEPVVRQEAYRVSPEHLYLPLWQR
jgi:uncharacterized protein YycO